MSFPLKITQAFGEGAPFYKWISRPSQVKERLGRALLACYVGGLRKRPTAPGLLGQPDLFPRYLASLYTLILVIIISLLGYFDTRFNPFTNEKRLTAPCSHQVPLPETGCGSGLERRETAHRLLLQAHRLPLLPPTPAHCCLSVAHKHKESSISRISSFLLQECFFLNHPILLLTLQVSN